VRLHQRPGFLALLAAAAAASSCLTSGGAVTLHLAPTNLICPDRIPAKLFIDPRCPNGVCGYTCEPGRWREWLTHQLQGEGDQP
jgi:hypothetical protein